MKIKRFEFAEGAFCVWTFEELEKLLVKDGDRKDFEIFTTFFNVLPAGNVASKVTSTKETLFIRSFKLLEKG